MPDRCCRRRFNSKTFLYPARAHKTATRPRVAVTDAVAAANEESINGNFIVYAVANALARQAQRVVVMPAQRQRQPAPATDVRKGVLALGFYGHALDAACAGKSLEI